MKKDSELHITGRLTSDEYITYLNYVQMTNRMGSECILLAVIPGYEFILLPDIE